MTTYSYAQLEGLWIDAGGPRAVAPIAAAIAEAESRGNSDAYNPRDTNGWPSAGLWQINNAAPAPPGWQDPATNAKMAVAKYRGAPGGGDNFTPWGTFTSGAYKHFLSPGTTPITAGGGTGGGVSAQTGGNPVTVDPKAQNNDCLWSINWAGIGGGNPVAQGAGIASGLIPGFGIVGAVTSGGSICLLTRAEVRAMVGTLIYGAGILVGVAGLAVLAAAAGAAVAAPVAAAAAPVGTVVGWVPGGQAAGAAIKGAAGRKPKRSKLLTRDRPSRGAREDAALEKRLGQPKENKDLEVRGGTVRESASQAAARKRRQAAAARARARKAAGQGKPATREEAGF